MYRYLSIFYKIQVINFSNKKQKQQLWSLNVKTNSTFQLNYNYFVILIIGVIIDFLPSRVCVLVSVQIYTIRLIDNIIIILPTYQLY